MTIFKNMDIYAKVMFVICIVMVFIVLPFDAYYALTDNPMELYTDVCAALCFGVSYMLALAALNENK